MPIFGFAYKIGVKYIKKVIPRPSALPISRTIAFRIDTRNPTPNVKRTIGNTTRGTARIPRLGIIL